ncbi:DUF4105 domain-containing protein [Marinilabiliaceae bacterium ANBcel2]|nr:DUF4105 domain-containing protein [Marinilabiliaceae bacterium ANBcel2]
MLFILLNTFQIFSQHEKISDEASISILTCSSGDELYSLFGHTAIRVNDPVNDFDYVFNYGTFDFNTPNFYLKFMRGELNYMLSVSTYNRFLNQYKYDERDVYEQKLSLTDAEVETLFLALIENSKTENRYYKYHFFFDNCATRVRDIIADNIYQGVVFKEADYFKDMTFRDAIETYLKYRSWTKLGLDLILGAPTDDVVDKETVQFLPDFLMMQFDNAVNKKNSEKIVSKTTTVIEFDREEKSLSVTPDIALWLAALLISFITFYEFKQKRLFKAINILIFATTTVVGLLIVFLWFFTSHTVTGPNWHILWANPAHILIIVQTFKNKTMSKTTGYFLFFLSLPIIFMPVLVLILNQYIPLVLIAVWYIMVIRIALIFYNAGVIFPAKN